MRNPIKKNVFQNRIKNKKVYFFKCDPNDPLQFKNRKRYLKSDYKMQAVTFMRNPIKKRIFEMGQKIKN